MTIKKAGLLVLVLSVLILGAWLFQRHGAQQCGRLRLLQTQVSVPLLWLQEAAMDPFQLPLLRQGPAAEALQEIKKWSTQLANTWQLSQHKKSLDEISKQQIESPEFMRALQSLAQEKVSCPVGQDLEFTRKLAAAGRHWQERQIEVRISKIAFQRDQGIYCHGEGLLTKLKALLAASQARCEGKRARKRSCGPAAMDSIRKEIEELEKGKDFNWQKLQRKWPMEVLKGIQCLSS